MLRPGLLDEAMLKNEFRHIYKEIGYTGMLQVLYEMTIAAQFCAEVIKEEYEKSNDK